MNKIPNREDCEEILKKYGTPKHVIAHCNAVCKVAMALAKKLNEAGYSIDIPLLRASALLHDIARVHEEHEKVGAEYLRNQGYGQVADVIAKHTKYSKFSDINNINEIDLLCIGDRTVKEDKYVGVDERMAYIKEKAIRNNRAAFVDGIEIGRKQLKKYIEEIESIIGISLDDLMEGNYE